LDNKNYFVSFSLKLPGTKRLATMLADLQILIFYNAINSSPGKTFIIEHLYISSLIVFKLDARADKYKFPAQQLPIVGGNGITTLQNNCNE
jgi:hypothetical protein